MFVKLYGVVGLAFFLFSKHKWRFVLSFFAWAVAMFVLPMLISSPEYIVGQYDEWYHCLVGKNEINIFGQYTNISLLGLVRKIGAAFVGQEMAAAYSDLWLIVPGCLLFALPYLRFKQWKNLDFRIMFLASTLFFLVLFSTGSESSGYITPFVGICLWYACVPWRRGRWALAMVVFAFILTSMSPTDIFPAYLKNEFVRPYALKALPCAMIWLWLMFEMLTKDYSKQETTTQAELLDSNKM